MKILLNNSHLLSAFLCFFILSACSSGSIKTATERTPAATDNGQQTPNYPELFKASREILMRDLMTPKHHIQKKFKDLPESQLIEHLQKESVSDDANPTSAAHEELIRHLTDEASVPFDPSKHLRLIPPPGTPGYSELHFYSSHPYFYNETSLKSEKEIPADNLVTVWNDFLLTAKKQIILNVYDFDLKPIADTLVLQGKKGLSVRVGIDKDVIDRRPEVKKIFDYLVQSNVVSVTAVDSVKLNHQKMAAIDWEDLPSARVLFSSGNLTQSCLDPAGDIKDIQPHPTDSIPNANHVITMKSWLLANLINHELTKTLDPGLQLRGAQYPMTGAYQVTGPQVEDPANLFSEARPKHSVIITFSPGGGYKDINSNLIARLIDSTEGPIRIIQFAFSADAVGEALFRKAQTAYLHGGEFDLLAIGDTPFAMQNWSEFLRLSGWKLLTEKTKDKQKKNKYFVEDQSSPWYKVFTAAQWTDLRSKIFVAPKVYRTHSILIAPDTKRDVSAKIHHKILSIGDFAIAGTSFNFSSSAQDNNEQILVFHEPDLARRVDGLTRWLIKHSGRTVTDEAQKRNTFNEPIEEEAEAAAP